jgi:hypothetical protein
MRLRSAYFPDFKGGPKVLFWGDAAALHQLGTSLERASARSERQELAEYCDFIDGKEIALERAARSRGMVPIAGGFRWVLRGEHAARFASLINALARSNVPAHQYLVCEARGEIIVMVSSGEYPAYLRP